MQQCSTEYIYMTKLTNLMILINNGPVLCYFVLNDMHACFRELIIYHDNPHQIVPSNIHV